MAFAFWGFFACTSGGGAGDADADVDSDGDSDSTTDSCVQPCDCVDCGGHGVCVNVGGSGIGCQCDEDWVPDVGPTCIATSVADPITYCADNPVRCLTLEWTALSDDCGADECVPTWTHPFDLVADMYLYRLTTDGIASPGCDCTGDVTVEWLVDGECASGGEGLVQDVVYSQRGLPPTAYYVSRELGLGTHSLRGFRSGGCGGVLIDSVRLDFSPLTP